MLKSFENTMAIHGNTMAISWQYYGNPIIFAQTLNNNLYALKTRCWQLEDE